MATSIWMVSAESAPLAQVGGLADVLRALPPALARAGHTVRRFLPAYGSIDRAGFAHDDPDMAVPLGPARIPVRLLSRTEPDGVRTTLLECEEMFAREGLYDSPRGAHPDNARRFTLLCRAVVELAARAPKPPDVLHGHDWHAALLPLFVRFAWGGRGRRPRTVLTLHNMGYQGRFGSAELDWITLDSGLRERLLRTADGLEFDGGISFLKAGLLFADRITAVSPRYAWEITTPEGGFGLDGVVRWRAGDLVGILNGADYEVWDPRHDREIPETYDRDSLERKGASRRALREAFGIKPSPRPLLGVVSRLVHQKGIDLVADAAPRLLATGADLILLGAGEGAVVGRLETLRREHPERIGLYIGYHARLSHLVLAGSDLLLVPSRYEPCGLSQMHALRYGTIPIVRRTGGLADTVRDEGASPGEGTGFVFDDIDPGALAFTVGRALALRASDSTAWTALQRRAMAEDFSWARAAAAYAEIYRGLS